MNSYRNNTCFYKKNLLSFVAFAINAIDIRLLICVKFPSFAESNAESKGEIGFLFKIRINKFNIKM